MKQCQQNIVLSNSRVVLGNLSVNARLNLVVLLLHGSEVVLIYIGNFFFKQSFINVFVMLS